VPRAHPGESGWARPTFRCGFNLRAAPRAGQDAGWCRRIGSDRGRLARYISFLDPTQSTSVGGQSIRCTPSLEFRAASRSR
jgi:hypothetical protein